jgi:hypothetical protein
MCEEKMVEQLERLCVTLKAISDTLESDVRFGSFDKLADIADLSAALNECRSTLESSRVGRLVRINRELRAQLATIRDMAEPPDENSSKFNDEPTKV